MKLKIIVVGKTKENFLQSAEEFYTKRIQRYTKLDWQVVKEEKITDNSNDRIIKDAEGARIQKKINPGGWTVAMDMAANQLSSREFADYMLQKMNSGLKCITFIIGGPLGISEKLLQNANDQISLSKMTFTHEMSRMILLEQIYRAFTIINGEKYHK